MIGRIIHYHHLKRNRLPHRLAWAMSGLKFHAHKVIRAMAFLLCVVGVLFLMSDFANAAKSAESMNNYSKINQQELEIKELRKIVETCLKGNASPIWIGNELFFCGISTSGILK